MINIAIVLEATLGGTRKHVTDLLLNMPEGEFRLTYIYSRKRADQTFLVDIEYLQQQGIDCIDLPMSNMVYHPSNLACIISLVRIFREKQIQVIHLHGAIAGTLGRVAAVFCKDITRIIYSPHGGVMHKLDHSLAGKLFQRVEKMLVSRRLHFIAVSSDEKEKISSLLGVDASIVSLIHNGIQVPDGSKENAISRDAIAMKRKELGLDEHDFVLLYPALFLEAKGHLNFFKTLKALNTGIHPLVKILLAGDGPLQPEVEELVAGQPFQKQVRFLGFIEKIEELFVLADAVLLPSNNEAFGYVLLEAMCFGKPIFATAVGGIKDIVEQGKNGFLYQPEKIRDMITDINRFSLDKEQVKLLSSNAFQLLSQKFDVKDSTRRIATLYKAD